MKHDGYGTRELMAAALIGWCDAKTVGRFLKGKLPVRKDTRELLNWAMFVKPGRLGPRAIDLLLERADELHRIARKRTGGKRHGND